jgi:hypothetical protein
MFGKDELDLDCFKFYHGNNLRRRNERERVRVKFVNEAFDMLRGTSV